ncbi:MAG: hypothetical protein ACRCS8_03865 [Brevinema sp.]
MKKDKKVQTPLKKTFKNPMLITLILMNFSAFFFVYELSTIKNPFMDPVAPYFLWAGLLLVSFLFYLKLNKVTR